MRTSTRRGNATTARRPGWRRRTRLLAGGLALASTAAVLASCEVGSTIVRLDAPQTLTGAQLPTLVGAAPASIVAFAHVRVDDVPTWRQIPVQVDERKVVPYGTQPANNTVAGTTGTIYGSGSGGPTLAVYADPGTWVGADGDATFDADDELTFMVNDAGGTLEPGDPPEPTGVVPGSGRRVGLSDPLDGAAAGSVYLFRSAGALVPSAGADYVNYQFNLTSGAYKTTYKRRTGPNPETSKVTTANYEIDYTDRWFETSWKLKAGGATQADILDVAKNQFAIGYCGRSNATFAAAEGAFVTNIDGPVRAIRSYVGANSGPNTQRTHLMYRSTEVVLTDLRVHSIPGIMDFIDYAPAAAGMTYRSETVPGGVPVDGTADAVPTGLTDWEALTGPQGSLFTNVRYESSINPPGGFETKLAWFYRDQSAPPEEQCLGDGSLLGASGPSVISTIPETDPANTATPDTLRGIRTNLFAAPLTDGPTVTAAAGAWAAQLTTPLIVSVQPA